MSALKIKPREKMNWDLCLFCQKNRNVQLRKPFKQTKFHKAYDAVQRDIEQFNNAGIPIPFNISKESLLNESESDVNLAEHLLKMQAVFHKSCRDLIGVKEMVRSKGRLTTKRKLLDLTNQPVSFPAKKTRLSFDSSVSRSVPTCVCCLKSENDSDEKLHRVTFTDGKDPLKDMALQLLVTGQCLPV